MTRGVKQGDPLSPILFNAVMDEIIAVTSARIGLNIDNIRYDIMAFADDLCVMASSSAGLQSLLHQLAKEASCAGLTFSSTKSATISKIVINRKSIITAKNFTIK